MAVMSDEIPQWRQTGDGRYETVDALGRRWQFWPVDDPTTPTESATGWRLTTTLSRSAMSSTTEKAYTTRSRELGY